MGSGARGFPWNRGVHCRRRSVGAPFPVEPFRSSHLFLPGGVAAAAGGPTVSRVRLAAGEEDVTGSVCAGRCLLRMRAPRPLPSPRRRSVMRSPSCGASRRPPQRRTGHPCSSGRRSSRSRRSWGPRRPGPTAGSRSRSTPPPKCSRTSSATCAARRVRPSYIVSRIVETREIGVEVLLDQLDILEQLPEALEGVVLALDGDEDLLRGDKGVDGEQPKAGRTVDEHVGPALSATSCR